MCKRPVLDVQLKTTTPTGLKVTESHWTETRLWTFGFMLNVFLVMRMSPRSLLLKEQKILDNFTLKEVTFGLYRDDYETHQLSMYGEYTREQMVSKGTFKMM